jgi:hypothetical protein
MKYIVEQKHNQMIKKLVHFSDLHVRLYKDHDLYRSILETAIEQWKEYFLIKIPDEINFSTVIEVASQIFEKYQRAAYFRDKQTVQMSILEQAKVEKYHTAYQAARNKNEREFGKPLAAESCKTAANLATLDLEDAISNQRVIRDFWNKTCDTLTELRKLLELMARALSGDAYISRDFVVKGNNND